jgi:periplasmic protein TonB
MAAHVDILEQPDRLSGWLIGSLSLHIAFASALIWYTVAGPGKAVQWGSPTGGGFGAVAVNPVARIPLPSNAGPQNPVANDTKSMVPTPPPKAKPQPKAQPKQPDETAIALKGRAAKERPKPYSAPNKFREQQKDLPNQVYNSAGQALSSPMYAKPGGGGVGVGDNSPFGTQFGWYAERLMAQVGQHWQTAGLDPRSHAASVVFTIRRDGSVTGVRLSQSSGNMAMDLSAQRAIFESQPFAPLPPQFPRNEATVELKFVLQ